MPGRKYAADDAYRYGFNGKENDNEVKGEGNQQDYGFRIYDPRLGRFLSVDPLTKSYPWYTPYQFAGNKPIWATDLDGLEERPFNNGDRQIENSFTYLTYATKASITNNIIRLTPSRHKRNLRTEFAKMGITDDEFIDKFQIRMRTIVTNHPRLDGYEAWVEIENKFVIEEKQSLGREFIEATFDVLATLSVLPSSNSPGILMARGSGFFILDQFRKSMGILYNVRRLSTVGVNNALQGLHKLEDVMEAGMAFVGKNAKKLYTKGGRFEGWESSDGLKRFRPSAYKQKQGKYQSNFEQRTSKDVNWDDANKSNMHVDTDKGFDFQSEKISTPKPAGSGG